MELQPHQQRVIDEMTELNIKLDNLSKFIQESALFIKLDDEEKNRLLKQHGIMMEYSNILQDRINAF
jgi:capsid portal protein